MKSFMETKKGLKKEIMAVVHSAKKADKTKLVAELCLNTGFRKETIEEILNNMVELDYITIENGIIKIVPPKPTDEDTFPPLIERMDQEKGETND